jgi:hypothetical protein
MKYFTRKNTSTSRQDCTPGISHGICCILSCVGCYLLDFFPHWYHEAKLATRNRQQSGLWSLKFTITVAVAHHMHLQWAGVYVPAAGRPCMWRRAANTAFRTNQLLRYECRDANRSRWKRLIALHDCYTCLIIVCKIGQYVHSAWA